MSANGSHQGVVAVAAIKDYVTVTDILNIAKDRGESPLIVVCDEITDPHNFGAIIRTAECCGAHGVILPKRRSAGQSAIVSKTSAGAVNYMALARVPNIPSVLTELKENGVWIYGAEAASGNTLWNTDFKGACALVIGAEGKGLGRLVREHCDFLVEVPMFGHISSLNASVSAAVLLYEAVRQRTIR
jgi:23S rRNA (guanosine2251-2'-O)-methyltransferase